MSTFSFTTDAQSEEYCYEIIAAMVRDCHIGQDEALRRINERWAGITFVGELNLIYHEVPETLAKHIYYDKDQFWWLDERGLQSVPLEPAKELDIDRSSSRASILDALKYSEAEVRAWAARWLRYDRNEDHEDLINHALSSLLRNDPDARVRYWSAYALVGVRAFDPSPAVISPALRAALHDPERGVRMQAANGLGKQKLAENVAPLVEALSDSEGCVRWRAADALGHLSDTRAILALIAALQDAEEEEYVCVNALHALERLKVSPPLQLLLDLLKRCKQQNEISLLGSKIAGELARSGPSILQPMLALLDSDTGKIRGIAAQALGSLADERAHQALLRVMQDDPSERVRFMAYRGLRSQGHIHDESEADG